MIRLNVFYFWITISLFITEVGIALFVDDAIVRPYIGDLLVVILIYSFVRTFFDFQIIAAAIGSLIFAYIVEVSQFFHLVQKLGLQKSTVARVVLGSSFSWIDILMYTIGITIAAFFDRKIGHE